MRMYSPESLLQVHEWQQWQQIIVLSFLHFCRFSTSTYSVQFHLTEYSLDETYILSEKLLQKFLVSISFNPTSG